MALTRTLPPCLLFLCLEKAEKGGSLPGQMLCVRTPSRHPPVSTDRPLRSLAQHAAAKFSETESLSLSFPLPPLVLFLFRMTRTFTRVEERERGDEGQGSHVGCKAFPLSNPTPLISFLLQTKKTNQRALRLSLALSLSVSLSLALSPSLSLARSLLFFLSFIRKLETN